MQIRLREIADTARILLEENPRNNTGHLLQNFAITNNKRNSFRSDELPCLLLSAIKAKRFSKDYLLTLYGSKKHETKTKSHNANS